MPTSHLGRCEYLASDKLLATFYLSKEDLPKYLPESLAIKSLTARRAFVWKRS